MTRSHGHSRIFRSVVCRAKGTGTRLLLLLAAWSVQPSRTAIAQEEELLFKHLSIEQGLSQSIVEAVWQDRKGFLWFVTEDGLNKFDGYSFEILKHIAGDPDALIHNEIKCIVEDRQGFLWIGTFDRGLERFDPAIKRFTHFQNDPADTGSLSHNIVRSVLEDRRGRLWVGTGGGGLNLLNHETGTFTRYRHDPENAATISHDDVKVLLEDDSGYIWAGTGGGLNRLDPATGTFERFSHNPDDPSSISHDDVTALAQDHAGVVWVGTSGGGLNRLDVSSRAFRHYRQDSGNPRSLSHDSVSELLVDDTGDLWVGTDGGGLNRYDPDKDEFARHQHNPYRPSSLANDRICSLFQDRSGLLWVGTYGSGISRCNLKKKDFLHYRNDPNEANSLAHNIVWSFCEDPEGILWIGTHDGGLDRFDRSAGTFRHYRHNAADPTSLSHNSVRMVIRDLAGNLWAATNGGGLNRFDPSTGLFKHYRHDPGNPISLSHDELRMVFEDSRGTLWVGTYGGGLDRYDPSKDGFINYRNDPANPASISSDYVRTAFEDAAGILWFGTHGGGLNKYEPATETFTRYRNDPDDPSTLSNDFVFSIHESRDGGLWIATYGGGLNRFDRRAETFTAVRKTDGLPDDAIYGILEDPGGNLWLSTNSGLSRYHPGTGVSRNYTAADGLQSNEFNGGSYYQNTGGEMFFGGINGFNVFRPERIKDNDYLAPIVITDFQLFNRSVRIGAMEDGRTLLTRAVDDTAGIELSHTDRVVSFEFAALDFASPEKNRYAYKLEGFGAEWVDLGTRRFVMFTTLPAGNYVLRVKGTNGDGIWNEEGTSLRLVVLPPWWQSSWAYFLYTMLLVAIVAGIVRYEKGREREKGRLVAAELRVQAAELQSRTAEAETRALKAENERKTHELEEARKLQLSMLPLELPRHPHYEIAARMETATEVGGDYYDFHVGEDGTLTIAIGDATGHGTRAGIMVAIMKGLFSRMCTEPDLRTFFDECNRTLRAIGLGQIFMALTMLRLKTHEARVVAAAMPGLLIYKAATGRVEQVELSGMLLGTEFEIPYEETRFSLAPGDKVLLLSDGFLEQMNRQEEMLDYERCKAYFGEAAALPPMEIVRHLFRRFEPWRGGLPQSDDVTLLVLEVLR